MKYKNIDFYLLLAILLIPFYTISLYAQSYTIESIVTNKTELEPATGLTMKDLVLFNLSFNDNDDCVFTGDLSDGSRGIIFFSNGVTRLLAKSKPPSEVDDGDLINVDFPRINDNGTIIFLGTHILPGRVIKQTVYKFDEDSITPIASTGDPVQVKGLESTILAFDSGTSGFFPSLNNNEEIAFSALLSDDKVGFFVLSEEGIEPILVEGDPFPVFDGDETLVFADIPIINDLGEIAFRARFVRAGGNPDDFNDVSSGVFFLRDGVIMPVKLPGDAVPGTDGLVFWDEHISWFSLGNNSEVVYSVGLIIEGGDSENIIDRRGFGMFLWSEGITTPLILTGDKLNGTKGRFFGMSGVLAKDSINDFGDIVAPFATTNRGGIFLFSNDDIVPIFLPKELGPGNDKFTRTRNARINNKGNIVFSVEDFFGNDTIFIAKTDNGS